MTLLDRRTALLAIGAGCLGACSPLQISEQQKNPPKGGIGGTGIVGTLTDFGSLIVNGLRVDIAADAVLTSALGAIREDDLAIGHSLTIEAETQAGQLVAKRVHLTHPVIGRVSQTAGDGSAATVGGVTVLRESGAIGAFRDGATVAISGFWRGRVIIASRIDAVAYDTPTIVSGNVYRTAPQDPTFVGSLALNLGTLEAPQPGTFATAIGDPGIGELQVTDLRNGRFTGAAGALGSLSIEGFLEPTPTAPFFTVSGLGHSFDRNALLSPLSKDRALFSGPYAGTFVVENALKLPNDLTERRSIIQQVLAGGLDDQLIYTR